MNFEQVMNSLPRQLLAPLPTPIQRLSATEKMLDSPVKMYIKRDDLTGVGAGGNKVRSLEYIIGRAKADGCDVIVASGNGQSNLWSLAAACAARAGIKCLIVHNCEKPDISTGNAILNDLLDVERIYIGNVDSTRREEYMPLVMQVLKDRGQKPYLIRNGATTGRGALGYANAVIEMRDQCRRQNLEIKHIFAPGGNGGIAAGLIYGNAMLDFPFKIHIISVEDDKPTLTKHIETTIAEMRQITGLPFDFKVKDCADITDAYRGEGWSINTDQSRQMVKTFVRTEGIYIENVYTSKLMVGFEDMIKKGLTDGDAMVIHTGGFGSLFSQY